MGRIDLPLGAEDTMHQLFTRHLEGEEGNRAPLQGDMGREVENKRRLAHCGTCRNDDKVGFLQPARDGVEGRKSCR